MKKHFPLLLAFLFAAPISAGAASLSDLYKELDGALKEADSDMAYVAKHGGNCTNNISMLMKGINQARGYMEEANSALKKGFKKISSSGECKAGDKELKLALIGVKEAQSQINTIVTSFEQTPPGAGLFTSKNGHQIMMEAMAAADGYANCIPTKPGKPNSTPESLHYQAYHDGILELQKKLKTVASEEALRKINDGCKSASAQATWETASYDNGVSAN